MGVDGAIDSVGSARAPPRAFSYHALGDYMATGAATHPLKPADRPPLSRSVSDISRRPHASGSNSARFALFRPPDGFGRALGDATHPRHTFTLGQVPSFVHELTSLVALSADESTFRCHICFDDVAQANATALISCGHLYCTQCLKRYLELKIIEGNVQPVCFHPVANDDGAHARACGVALNPTQIECIVDDQHWAKFCRFRFNNEHEHARDCPYCLHSAAYSGPTNPECRCEICFKTFCFFHGNAHETGTCADYELKNAETEALNKAKIQEIAKPCPGCQRNVEKDGGCNHIKCVACHTSFCWLCGEVIEDALTPSHFDATAEGSCSGRQFDGIQSAYQQWWLRVYIVIATILCAPPAILLGLIISPVIWCLRPRRSFREIFESSVTNLTIVLQVPLAIAFFAVVLCLQGITRPFVYLFRLIRRGLCCTMDRQANSTTEGETDSSYPTSI